MNLADYLSELLGQYEEVSVPGLGYFVRERVNGYYNDNEAKFYPPYHKVKFIPQLRDDDTFTQYVADKKNISLASSKYFAEKFVSKLREQALTGKYLFADLGLFYTDQDQLVFKANDKIADDPVFYGYPQVNIYKQGQPSVNEQYSRTVFATAAAPPQVVLQQAAQPVHEEHYYEEEIERGRGINVWLVLLIAITAIALVGFGVYKFYPGAFDKVGAAYNKLRGKTDSVATSYQHPIKADTNIQRTTVEKDTVPKAVATPPAMATDTVKPSHFEVIAGNFKQVGYANREVDHLKLKGLDAKILTGTSIGPLLKVSVGSYPTYEAAEAARLELVRQGKISRKSTSLEIKQ